MIASDKPLEPIDRLEIIKKSFEEVGLIVDNMEITHDGNQAIVKLKDVLESLIVNMRERPSLVVGNLIFKLEEFDI